MGDKEDTTKTQDKKETLSKTNSEQSTEKVSKIHSESIPVEKIHSEPKTLFKNTVENTSSTVVYEKNSKENKINEVKSIENSKENEVQPNEIKEEKTTILTNDSPIPKARSPRLVPALSATVHKERIFRQQSDIFSLIEEPNAVTSIFSVSGAPSRRVSRNTKEHISNESKNSFGNTKEPPFDTTSAIIVPKLTRENYNDEKRPSSSYRNPLTGSGLSSNDEYMKKDTKRKVDGNPLLGSGYGADAPNSASAHRIPPGGFSHKLW